MDLTPRDIQDKQFHDAFRGYSHEEVDAFLDDVAVAFDAMFHEHVELERRIAELEEGPAGDAPRRAPTSEEPLASEAVEDARTAAARLLDDAQTRAREVLSEAQERAGDIVARAVATERELEARVAALRRFEEEYRARLHALVESQLRVLAEIPDASPVSDAVPALVPEDAAAAPRDPLPRNRIVHDEPAAREAPADVDPQAGTVRVHRSPPATAQTVRVEPAPSGAVLSRTPAGRPVASAPAPDAPRAEDSGATALKAVAGHARTRSAPPPAASRPEPAGPPPGPVRRQDTRPAAKSSSDGVDEEEHRSITRLFWKGEE